MGVPRFGGHERWSAYNVGGDILDPLRAGGVRTADCRREGAERSMFRWLPSLQLIGRWRLAKATWSCSKMEVDRHPEGFIRRV